MRRRRAITIILVAVIVLAGFGGAIGASIDSELTHLLPRTTPATMTTSPAAQALETLAVKGRTPKTDYTRDQFGDGWATVNGCSTRQIILYRDLTDITLSGDCIIATGRLNDPYSSQTLMYSRQDAAAVQIDHVVALSDAWQKGAQQLTVEQRRQLANDPLELLAVNGPDNQAKGDSDAATWLPPNKAYRCSYVARQIAIKQKYMLWVTDAEKTVMKTVLTDCPQQTLPA